LQSGHCGFQCSLFAKEGLPMCIFPQRWTDKNRTLTVNMMLSMAKWNELKVLKRIHAAVDCVNARDPQYAMHVEMDKSWCLVLKRGDLANPPDNLEKGGEPSTGLSASLSAESSTSPSSCLSPILDTEGTTTPSTTLSAGDSTSLSATSNSDKRLDSRPLTTSSSLRRQLSGSY